jgi:hypothetical protein
MSTTEFTQLAWVIRDYAWLAPLLPAVWFPQRTGIARTARIIRVTAWDWLMKAKGVLESTRRKLIADAARRDLESS